MCVCVFYLKRFIYIYAIREKAPFGLKRPISTRNQDILIAVLLMLDRTLGNPGAKPYIRGMDSIAESLVFKHWLKMIWIAPTCFNHGEPVPAASSCSQPAASLAKVPFSDLGCTQARSLGGRVHWCLQRKWHNSGLPGLRFVKLLFFSGRQTLLCSHFKIQKPGRLVNI